MINFLRNKLFSYSKNRIIIQDIFKITYNILFYFFIMKILTVVASNIINFYSRLVMMPKSIQ